MSRYQVFLLLVTLCHLCLPTWAQSATSSSSPSAISSQAQQSQLSEWVIPISGPSNELTGEWGVNVSTLLDNGQTDPNHVSLLPIAIPSGSPQLPSVSSTSSVYSSADTYDQDDQSESWIPAPGSSLLIGPNSNLTVSTPSETSGNSISTVNDTFSTLPFGINLGLANAYDGSLVFGGSYDANRVAYQATWQKLPGNSSDFLGSGRQEYTDGIRVGSPPSGSSQRVILDFQQEAVVITAGAATGVHCGQTLQIRLGDGQPVSIDASLLPTLGRCSESDSAVQDGSVLLGRPFFQAVYLYANSDMSLYFAQAGKMSMSPNPTQFAPDQALKTQPSPPPPPPAKKPSSGAEKVQVPGNSLAYSVGALLLLLVGAVLW